jgi:hypothetical protein
MTITIENLPIYKNDTAMSIVERIASIRNTVPILIYLPDGLPPDFRQKKTLDIQVVDTLAEINNELTSDRPSFASVYEKIKDGLKPSDRPFIALLWTFLEAKIMLDASPDSLPFAFMTATDTYQRVQEMMNISPVQTINDTNFPLQIEAFLNKLAANIADNKKHIELDESHTERPSVPYNEFQLESIKYEFILSVEHISLEDVFDAIVLNDFFPLAKLGSYYKIHKNYIPTSEDEIHEKSDLIQIFFRVGQQMKPIYLFFDIENKKLSLTLKVKLENIDTKRVISNILMTLTHLKAKVIEEKSFKYNGSYTISNQDMDRSILTHMIMNDDRFSRYLYIDEIRSPFTKVDYIYVHFVIPSSNEVFGALITPNAGQRMIRVKIVDALNMDNVIDFQETLARLFSIYNENKAKLLEIYQSLRPADYSKKTQKDNSKPGMSERKLPKNVFPGKYTRTCQPKERHVQVVNEEETADMNPKSFMVFPKSEEEGEQITYACKDPTYPYIGLIDFKKKNAYNFVPCCYETDRSKSDTFNRYFKGAAETSKFQTHTITTAKILDYMRTGTLDRFPNLNKMLQVLTKSKTQFLRTGVHRSPKSLLECVLLGMGLENKVESELRNIADDLDLLQCARQEIPNVPVDDIRRMLIDPEAFLDPKLFYRILEEKYRCKIYFFENDTFGIPNFKKNYLTFASVFKRPTLLILQHLGGETDIIRGQPMTPQCELIGTQMDFSNSIAVGLKSMFLNMTRSYFKGQLNTPCRLEFEPSSQVINAFGKTVALVHKESNLLFYLTSPIPPLVLPITEQYDLLSGNSVISKLTKIPFVSLIKKFNKTNFILSLEVTSQRDATYFVPIQMVEPNVLKVEETTNDNEVIPLPDGPSGLHYFTINKQLSWHIVQQLFFLFSKFLPEQEYNEQNHDTVIEKFLKQHTEQREDAFQEVGSKIFNHQIFLPQLFSEKSPLVSNNKVIILKDMLPKLNYRLKLAMNNNMEGILEFKNKVYLEKRIRSIEDFTIYPEQVLLNGSEMVTEYIKTMNLVYTPTDSNVDVENDDPYFFKFEHTSQVYLAKNFYTPEAVATNIGENPVSICSYVSPDKIKFLNENSVSKDFVLGYKYDGIVKYTTLLHGI